MTDPPISFNLWMEPWIRVTRLDGSNAELSIETCLSDAHTLAALSDPSPLVVGGTHRLLAAILQAIYTPRDLGEIAALLRAGLFNTARLAEFGARHAERFDIFHPATPFLQTGDVPLDGWRKPGKGQKNDWGEAKSIAALFAEIPAATKRTHFHHVTDRAHHFCPACCARGLVSLPAFASSEGAGIRPSINGVPPIYVLPAGDTLFETLVLSLAGQGFQPPMANPQRAAVAIWNSPATIGKSSQVSAVGYLESLTFPARRIRLYPQVLTTECTSCGSGASIVVKETLSEMGHWLSEGGGIWEDPFAAYRQPKGRSKSDDASLKPVRPEESKALWREYNGLLLAERNGQFRPRIVQQVAKLVERGALAEDRSVRFRCVGIRTDGKAKVFEWLDEALEAPPALLNDPEAALYVDDALQHAEEVRFIIESTFNSHFRPERDRGGREAKLARFQSIRARMIADYWQQLAPLFRQFIADLARPGTRDEIDRRWTSTLVRVGQAAFDDAAAQIGERADALRARVEGQAVCYRRLNAKRKEWFGE